MYRAGAVRDAAGVNASPGAVAFQAGRVVAAGPLDEVLKSTGRKPMMDLGDDWLLLPGLVNAHAHLDLTQIGYQPFTGRFSQWAQLIIQERQKMGSAGHAAAVERGVGLSMAAGVFTVGDIAGTADATEALAGSPLRGVSFVELFGIGVGSVDELAHLAPARYGRWLTGHRQGSGVRLGLQPHSPYSAGPALFRDAARWYKQAGAPLSTHLAELREELEFVAKGTGDCRGFLERIGKWNDACLQWYGHGLHPVEWLFGQTTHRAKWLLAHCNYVEDSHIELLARHGASVAYCPRASDYFGHRGHRYREMIAAGVNVCLGTDSIICHGTLSILDEMRHLHRRDHTDPSLLLRMATINGMCGLGMEEKDTTFTPGARPGLIAMRYDSQSSADPLEQVLAGKESPQVRVLALT